MLPYEESELIKRLAQPPKCMHDPKFVSETEFTWKCDECGLVAPKVTQCYLFGEKLK